MQTFTHGREQFRKALAAQGVSLDDLIARSDLAQWGTEAIRIGISGGKDSMGLALLAWANGQSVIGIHVDHGLRPGSDREGARIANSLAPFGIGVLEYRVVVDPGGNIEDRARRARLACLGDAATAHTMDDQAETVLANLLRGSGLVGVGAMQPGRRHPILRLRRTEMQLLCKVAGIAIVDDPSNDDPRFVRNRIRTELLPLAADILQRDVVEILARTASLAQEYGAAIDAMDLDTGSWQGGLPDVLVRHRLNRLIVAGLGVRLSGAHLERVYQVAIGNVSAHQIVGALTVRKEGDALVFVDACQTRRLSLNLAWLSSSTTL